MSRASFAGALACALVAVSASSPCQQPQPTAIPGYLTAAVGSGPGALSLFAVAEDGLQVFSPFAASSGFTLLPIDLAGRLDSLRFDPTRPRRLLTDDGLSRIALPGGVSIFHYRRGAATFGFLAVGVDGLPRILLELPGTGVAGATDPFQPFVAASRDGSRLAAATEDPAGGDVWLIPVGGGTPSNVGGSAPLDVDPGSLAFADGAIFFTGGDLHAYRAPADGSAPAALLPLPPSGGAVPVDVRPEFAVSDDGSTVAFVAGASEQAGDVYLVAPPMGPAVNLTQAVGEYEGVGYAPGTSFGPMLALAPDGSSIAYLKTVGASRELFLRPTGGGPPVQVTPDALFEPSIDNVVVVTIGAPAAVGFAGGGGGLGQLDVYQATCGPGGTLNVLNLTGTSGTFTPPFPNAGTIAIADAFSLPGSTTKVVVSANVGGFTARFVDPATASSSVVLAGQAWNGAGVGPAGGRIFFDALGPGGAPSLHAFTGGAAPLAQTLVTGPPGLVLDSLAASPAGTEVAFLASAGPGLDFAVRLAIPSASFAILNAGPLSFSRSLAYSPSGVPGFAVGATPAGPFLFALLAPSGLFVPPLPVGTGVYLR